MKKRVTAAAMTIVKSYLTKKKQKKICFFLLRTARMEPTAVRMGMSASMLKMEH